MPSPRRSSQTGVALASQSLGWVHFFPILEEVSAGISASSDNHKTILLICVWARITSAKNSFAATMVGLVKGLAFIGLLGSSSRQLRHRHHYGSPIFEAASDERGLEPLPSAP